MILMGQIISDPKEVNDSNITLVLEKVSSAKTYRVTIPFYGYTDGQSRDYTVLATAATFPGITFDYAKDDIVYISFFQNDIDGAIILGKVLETNLTGCVDTLKTKKIEIQDGGSLTVTKELENELTATSQLNGEGLKTRDISASGTATINVLQVNQVELKSGDEYVDITSALNTLALSSQGIVASALNGLDTTT